MARVAVIAALGLAGCAQLFGIDETTAPPDAPAAPFMSLKLERLSVGSALVQSPQDLTAETATYLIDDASDPSGLRRVQPTLADTHDTWTADIPEGTRAAVDFSIPGGSPLRRLYALPMRTVSSLFTYYEHPSPEAAPAGGVFSVALTLPSGYATNELIRLYAVGPWAYHDLAGAELPAINLGVTTVGPVNIPYTTMTFTSLVGARPLPKVTAQDQIVALRYVGNDLTAAGVVAPFDQTGSTDTVMASLATVPHAPLDVKIDPAMTAMRLAGTTPPVTTVSMAWYVHAAPAWKFANNTGPVLNAVSVMPTDSGTITGQFGNPFAGALGWTSLFTWSANRSRTYTVPAYNLPLTLYAGMNNLDDVQPGLVMDQPAGLPVLVSINKTPLNADGLTITLDPTKAVELSLVADRPTNLFYQWNIYEVVPNSAMPPTGLDLKIIYSALATETTTKIPSDVFVTGKTYMIRAHCVQGGYPSFSSGDLRIRDVPYAVGYFDAGVFKVAAP